MSERRLELDARLQCPQCSRIFGVGLLLYPVHPRTAPAQPSDQKATWQQMLAMRQLAGGFFMDKAQPIRGPEAMNLYVEQECTCWLEATEPPRLHQLASCPIHGWLDQPGAEEIVEPEETVRLIKPEPEPED